MSEQLIDGLFVSSMIFFNILCIVGIIAGITITVVIMRTSKKVNDTLEKVQEVADNAGEVTAAIVERVAPLLLRREKSFVERLFDYFVK